MVTEPTYTDFDQVKKRRRGRSIQVREAVMQAVRTELEEKGYSGVSHRDVASVAGVNFVTVYRRWPTRARLVADLFLDVPDTFVPVPDTGGIEGDLHDYLRSITQMLGDPGIKQLIQAFFAASIEGDEAVSEALAGIWRERFLRSYAMLDRAIVRRELPESLVREQVIEALVAPAWFRAFVSRKPMDEAFVHRTVSEVLSLARGT